VLAELERQSQVAGNWLDVAGSKVCSPPTPRSGSTSTRASGRAQPTSTARSFADPSPQPWARYHSTNSTQPPRVSGAPGYSKGRQQIGVPNLPLHDLRHTGNTLAAQSGASLRDLMTRMGHDSPAAALIHQHSSRVADEAIAAALDARLTERKSRLTPNVVGPVEGPTEPQLIAVEPGRSRKRASDQE
jgi:hypothetical protein